MNIEEWQHKDEYKRAGKNFCVLVTRHYVKPLYSHDDGGHRWCVYAYIYPKHPKFAEFDGTSLWQPATDNLPLHGGASLSRYHKDDKDQICSVQVGADYNHLYDAPYTRMATPEDAAEVFNDADDLFNVLQKMSEQVAV